MQDYSLFIQAGLVLMTLFMFFVLFMCAKTWNIFHVIFLFFVYAASVTFMFYAALVFKTQKAWREVHNDLTVRLEAENKLGRELTYGDPYVVAQPSATLHEVKTEFGNVIAGRGRVWRGCTPTNVMGNSVTVSTAPAALVEGETPSPNGIQVKAVLYVFVESLSADGWPVPAAYLGAFHATAASDTSVELTPLLPLDPEQVAFINRGGATWSLYDVLPVDGHDIYAGMNEAQLRELFPPQRLRVSQPTYDALLQELIRDGQPDTETDIPEHVWYRVKFVREYSVEVDGEAPAVELDAEHFDTTGRALAAALMQGKPTEFAIGDEAVFDRETAERLISDGVAQKVSSMYRRPLNDFEFEFQDVFQQLVALTDRVRVVQRDNANLSNAKTKCDAQIAFRTTEKTKLESDLTGFQGELAAVVAIKELLLQREADLRGQLSMLYRENRRLAQELAAEHQRLTDEINARTAAATASP